MLLPGYSVYPGVDDLYSCMTYKGDIALPLDDTLYIYTAIISLLDGTVDSLRNQVDRARAWAAAYAGMASPDTLFVFAAGTADRITPPSMARRLADAVPDGKQVILEEGGHPLWLDSRMNMDQIAAVFDAASGFREGTISGSSVLLDESGYLLHEPCHRTVVDRDAESHLEHVAAEE